MSDKVSPKKKGRKPKLDSELVAATLAELSGNIAGTAKRFNVTRTAVTALIKKRPILQQILRDARDGMLDNAESSLYRAVLEGQAWAVCFFLKTQGKARGYIERHEVSTGQNDFGDEVRKRLNEVDGSEPGQPGEARGTHAEDVANTAASPGDQSEVA